MKISPCMIRQYATIWRATFMSVTRNWRDPGNIFSFLLRRDFFRESQMSRRENGIQNHRFRTTTRCTGGESTVIASLWLVRKALVCHLPIRATRSVIRGEKWS